MSLVKIIAFVGLNVVLAEDESAGKTKNPDVLDNDALVDDFHGVHIPHTRPIITLGEDGGDNFIYRAPKSGNMVIQSEKVVVNAATEFLKPVEGVLDTEMLAIDGTKLPDWLNEQMDNVKGVGLEDFIIETNKEFIQSDHFVERIGQLAKLNGGGGGGGDDDNGCGANCKECKSRDDCTACYTDPNGKFTNNGRGECTLKCDDGYKTTDSAADGAYCNEELLLSAGKPTDSSPACCGKTASHKYGTYGHSDKEIGSSCTWSNDGNPAIAARKDAYWSVDLGKVHAITTVLLRSMGNLAGETYSLNVQVMACIKRGVCENCGSRITPKGTNSWASANCDGREGRFVVLSWDTNGNNWHFCRVLVNGFKPTTGHWAPKHDDGLKLLTMGKATKSSTECCSKTDSHKYGVYPSSDADIGSTCTWSNNGNPAIAAGKNKIWQVDLGTIKEITKVMIRSMDNLAGETYSLGVQVEVCRRPGAMCHACGGRVTPPNHKGGKSEGAWVHVTCSNEDKYIEGQFIRFKWDTNGNNWHWCRMEAWGRDSKVDQPKLLSAGKPTSSSTVCCSKSGSDKYGVYPLDDGSIASSCTWSNDGNPAIAVGNDKFWQVDLQETYDIQYISLRAMDNLDSKDYSADVQFQVCTDAAGQKCKNCGGRVTPAYEDFKKMKGGWAMQECKSGDDFLRGRYVRLERSHTGNNWHFCRVAVEGYPVKDGRRLQQDKSVPQTYRKAVRLVNGKLVLPPEQGEEATNIVEDVFTPVPEILNRDNSIMTMLDGSTPIPQE